MNMAWRRSNSPRFRGRTNSGQDCKILTPPTPQQLNIHKPHRFFLKQPAKARRLNENVFAYIGKSAIPKFDISKPQSCNVT